MTGKQTEELQTEVRYPNCSLLVNDWEELDASNEISKIDHK